MVKPIHQNGPDAFLLKTTFTEMVISCFFESNQYVQLFTYRIYKQNVIPTYTPRQVRSKNNL